MEIIESLKPMVHQLVLFIKEWGELLLSTLAFLLSIVAMAKASKAEKLQNKINELELKIKQYEVEKIEKEKEEESLSCVEARVIAIGNGKYRLKVWNSGNAPAYNVTAKFDGNPELIIIDREKQPFEFLDAKKSYEMTLVVYSGSASKFKIITEWTDASGENHSKIQMDDLK